MSLSAIVLAGGRGTRLQSIINDIPKPMAPIADKPFLTYLLNQLMEAGVRHVVLSVGYKYKVILDYFGCRYKDIILDYAIEETPLGTGGGIRQAIHLVKGETALVVNGDTFFDANLASFINFHRNQKNDVSLLLRHVDSTARYGSVALDNQRITGFLEKTSNAGSGYINGGIYLIKKDTLLQNTTACSFSFEMDFLQTFYHKLLFGGYVDDGYFIDIGIPDDYHKANAFFKKI